MKARELITILEKLDPETPIGKWADMGTVVSFDANQFGTVEVMTSKTDKTFTIPTYDKIFANQRDKFGEAFTVFIID